MKGTIALAFILLLVLILAAYYVGVTSDATAIGGQVLNLVYGVSGRTTSGAFAGYPGGGGTPATA